MKWYCHQSESAAGSAGQVDDNGEGDSGSPAQNPVDDGRPEERAQKRQRTESLVLPEWLRKCIAFEHMTPSELSECRPHIPVEEYADFLEVAAKVRRAGTLARSSRSRRGQVRCTRCGKDRPAGFMALGKTCIPRHHQAAVPKLTQDMPSPSAITSNRKQLTMMVHPCCQQQSGSRGCTPGAHDWMVV
eukprot:UN1035